MAGGARGERLGRALSSGAVAVGCVLFLGGFVLAAALYQPYTVPTASMAPSVAPGDRVLAQRIDGVEVRRGDIVVFREPAWGNLPMVKRVVGVGGDTVACCDSAGLLLVNGEPIDEPYLAPGPVEPGAPAGSGGGTTFEAAVPTGELFVLGDHRADSLDSRSRLTASDPGSVPRTAVTARVVATVWPLGRIGPLPVASGFADLPGGVSGPGPLLPLAYLTGAGAVLIVVGAGYGPAARRVSRSGHRGVAGAPRDAQ